MTGPPRSDAQPSRQGGPLPEVSVIIPVFDAAPYVGEAIESVLSQEGPSIEVIVVDDGSTDGSAGVIASYGRRIRAARQERAGTGAARNRGLALARGRLLAFLDADDRYPPRSVATRVEALERDPGLDTAAGHVREFVSPDTDAETRRLLRPTRSPTPGRVSSALLLRREALDRMGPFSEAFTIGVDLDFAVRALEAGLTLAMLPQVVLERRLHGANNGLRQWHQRTQYAEVLKASLDRRRGRG
jgi:glycosyltransferase involved in cell wall biosynthesis